MKLLDKKDCNCHENAVTQAMLAHDALHCPHCSKQDKMLQALELLAGIEQAILSKIDGSFGIPRGSVFQFSQSSPAQGTLYTSPAAPYDGVLYGLTLSGSGDVTLSVNNENLLNGAVTIGVFSVSGTASIGHHIAVPVGSTITIKTTAAAATNISFSAWLEPSMMNASEFFRIRR